VLRFALATAVLPIRRSTSVTNKKPESVIIERLVVVPLFVAVFTFVLATVVLPTITSVSVVKRTPINVYKIDDAVSNVVEKFRKVSVYRLGLFERYDFSKHIKKQMNR